MATINNANTKICVTCEYWNGERVAGPLGREVKHKFRMSDSDSGICKNKSSIKKGRTVRSGDIGCPSWLKWNQLK